MSRADPIPADAWQRVRRRGFRLLVAREHAAAAARLGLDSAEAFDRLHAGATRLAGGRAGSLRWTVPPPGSAERESGHGEGDDTWRVRPLHHGGWLARLLGDRYLSPRRVERELTLWRSLHHPNGPVPEPVLAVSRRVGPVWRSSFASVERSDALDAGRWLATDPAPERVDDALRALARTLRRLHDEGVLHGDLHPGNVLIEPIGPPGARASETDTLRCWLIDLTGARRFARVTPARRMREWMRLARGLEKTGRGALLDRRRRALALRCYCEGDRGLRRAMLRSVPREQRRLARHRLGWRLAAGLRRGPGGRARASAKGLFAGLLQLPGLLGLLLPLLLLVTGCPAGDGGAVGTPPSGDDAPRHSLLAVGDTGRTRPLAALFEGSRAVAAAMTEEARRAPVDGLVLLGDNFYWRGLERARLVERTRENLVLPFCHFLALDGPRSAEVASACPLSKAERDPVPVFAVLGNHDLETPESAALQRRTLPAFLPGWRMSGGLAEAVELGEGLSLVLFESEPAIDDPDAIRRALGRALEAARGPWRILATHRPIATDDLGRVQVGGYPQFVLDAIEASGVAVQLVLAGHHHSLQVFELGGATPLLHVGVGSGARAEPPLASDHPDARFGRLALGFARVDLQGAGKAERLVVTLFEVPRWPALAALTPTRPVARFAVDAAGRVEQRSIPLPR